MKAQKARNPIGDDADTGIPVSGESAVGAMVVWLASVALGVLLAIVALLAVFVWVSWRWGL